MIKSAKIIPLKPETDKEPAAKRIVTKKKVKPINTLRVLRKHLLGLNQTETATILGFASLKSVYDIEISPDDRVTIQHIRILYAYAKANGIEWPADLMEKLLHHNPATGISPVKRGSAPL